MLKWTKIKQEQHRAKHFLKLRPSSTTFNLKKDLGYFFKFIIVKGHELLVLSLL